MVQYCMWNDENDIFQRFVSFTCKIHNSSNMLYSSERCEILDSILFALQVTYIYVTSLSACLAVLEQVYMCGLYLLDYVLILYVE